jgi:glycosyltransferase involved in cell wall biosynthesis
VTETTKPFVVPSRDSISRGNVAGDSSRAPSETTGETTVETTVIVPFHRNLSQLSACLAAIRRAAPGAELIVAADGALDDCRPLAAAHRARVIEIDGPQGPAAARNHAAAVATGEVLIFVDTDVVVAEDAIERLSGYLAANPGVAGVFGAYDEEPPERNFSSRYRNLSHSYVHQRASTRALTFWGGLGALRADAFNAIGGFDERFRRPCVEDIDLGYRLSMAGYELRVEAAARGRHLKRWTLLGGVVSDVRDRGVPWTQLILRSGLLANDLNTSTALRVSLVLSYVLVGALLAAPFLPTAWAIGALAVAGGGLAALVALNWEYYRWFQRREGTGFAVRVIAVHILHHLCNGVSLAWGAMLTFASRRGIQLPGALPAGPWTGHVR